jgi:hypothetical protein
MTTAQADTPAKRVYLAVQLMLPRATHGCITKHISS